jgi:hypothetical protein
MSRNRKKGHRLAGNSYTEYSQTEHNKKGIRQSTTEGHNQVGTVDKDKAKKGHNQARGSLSGHSQTSQYIHII